MKQPVGEVSNPLHLGGDETPQKVSEDGAQRVRFHHVN